MSERNETSLESQLAELASRAQPSADGWQAILARARRQDRRRRSAVAAALSVAVVVATIVVWPRLHPGNHGTGVSVASPTVAAPPGARPPGPAAWVSGNQLWVYSGSGALRPVTGSSPAADPEWSYDGQWISYLRGANTAHPELWVVRPDGSGNTEVWNGKPGGIEWSPTAEELAVSDTPAVGIGGLAIVTPNGTRQTVVPYSSEVNSFAWAPDGQSIALSEVMAPADTFASPLDIVTVHGPDAGLTTTVLRAGPDVGIAVGPWWPSGKGLLYWFEPQYSRSVEASGLTLMSTTLAGTAPVTLATTLVSLPWLSWAPNGQLLVVSGSGAQPSDNKSLELCTPATGACTKVPTPADTVSLDPSVSPDGQQVAFVLASQSASATSAWFATRRLWVFDLDNLADAHAVAGASAGTALPSWGADGLTIGYSTATDVESIPAAGGKPTVVSGAAALTGSTGLDGETALGKTTWASHAVWAPASGWMAG